MNVSAVERVVESPLSTYYLFVASVVNVGVDRFIILLLFISSEPVAFTRDYSGTVF